MAGAPDPKVDEIEITPEMIAAGAEEITNYYLGLVDADKETEKEAVESIYRRMEEVRRKSNL